MAAIVLSAVATGLVEAAGIGSAALIGNLTVGGLAGMAGQLIGSAIDSAIFGGGSGSGGVVGPRLSQLYVMGAGEGGAVPLVLGRARTAGQLLRATRFRERATTSHVGGKGGSDVTSYGYSISLAIGICEGPVSRLIAVRADEQPFDLSSVLWRFYPGTETQMPDPLWAALDGGAATAYRGLAYIVFEDLPLAAFGNRIPQFDFEVLCPTQDADAPGAALRAVCLIPGTGEFAPAVTAAVRKDVVPVYENRNTGSGVSDFVTSLDDLAAAAPNVRDAALTIGRFADDLRAGKCTVTPRVDRRSKVTRPMVWRSENDTRASAPVTSTYAGGAAYGGTPADAAVAEGLKLLQQRGIRAWFYPLLLCDIPQGNAQGQPAYPWRGRITGSSAADVQAFFGNARAAHFRSDGTYAGPAGDRGYARTVLHYAALCASIGGVPGFVIGSELVGLTRVRVNRTQFPAVDALRTLAAEVRKLLPGSKIIYGADWTEYGAYVPADGSGDVLFPLDALWADPNIDEVAIDWYPPLSDTRDDNDPDSVGYADRTAFLQSRIRAGEAFDWYYASAADRAAGRRTPITDGAYGEAYIFRPKALAEWWSNPHRVRLGGVRQSAPTAWIPQSKPVRLLEFGCGAVDRGANAPNVFPDPKSSEGGLPPFSRGTSDAAEQRALLNAYLRHYATTGAHNPTSSVYGAPMLTPDRMHAWCWDTRPFPAFPGLSSVWRDAAAWSTGHWLNGRLESPSAASLLQAIAARAGVPATADGVRGQAYGLAVSAQTSGTGLLLPSAAFFGADAIETADGLRLTPRDGSIRAQYTAADMRERDDASGPRAPLTLRRADPLALPAAVTLTYADIAAGYAPATAAAGELHPRRTANVDTVLVSDAATAGQTAERLLAEARLAGDEITFALPPSALQHLPGDRITVTVYGATEVYRITRTARARAGIEITAVRTEGALFAPLPPTFIAAGAPQRAPVQPSVQIAELPVLGESDTAPALTLAVSADPWPGLIRVYRDDALSGDPRRVLDLTAPASVGVTVTDLWSGPRECFDIGNALWVQLGADDVLSSCTQNDLLNGANAAAVYNAAVNDWEILQFMNAEAVDVGKYKLTRFLRGRHDTDDAAAAPLPAGAPFVLLNSAVALLPLSDADLQRPLTLRIGPAAADPLSDAFTLVQVTPTGRGLRPFAPGRLRAVRQGDGSVLCAWVRRSRVGGDSWDAPDVPQPEAVEMYDLQAFDASGNLLQQLSTSSTSVSLSAGAARIRVRQRSSRVAVGRFAEVSVW